MCADNNSKHLPLFFLKTVALQFFIFLKFNSIYLNIAHFDRNVKVFWNHFIYFEQKKIRAHFFALVYFTMNFMFF